MSSRASSSLFPNEDDNATDDTASEAGSRAHRVEAAHRKKLEEMGDVKRRQLERAEEELAKVTATASDAKRRCEALSARREVLEKENRSMKQSVKTLLEKTENDDRLVEALRAEIAKVCRQYGSHIQPYSIDVLAFHSNSSLKYLASRQSFVQSS